MRVLVTGGAGYIGSVVGVQLVAAGHDVTVLDDLSTGFADAVPPGATFVKGTLRDCAAEVLADGAEAVLHFAAKSLVGESVGTPITETDPARPTSPYGATKVAVDTTLSEFCRLYGFGAVSLPYFNVAGAFQGAGGRWLGERHNPETHLSPN